MWEDVLKSIGELEGVNIPKSVLNMSVDDKFSEPHNLAT